MVSGSKRHVRYPVIPVQYMYPCNQVLCGYILLQLMKKNNDLKVVGFSHNGWSAVLGNLVKFIGFHSKIRMSDA